MKILYLTDNSSVHNRRFLEKLVAAGHEVWSWNLTSNLTATQGESCFPKGVRQVASEISIESDASPEQYRQLLPQLESVLREFAPAVIHAGPIQSAGYLAALADFHPLLLMSWGSDLLFHAHRNSEWEQATEFALRRANAFFCDCDSVRAAAKRYREFSDSQIVQFPWGVKRGVFSPTGPQPPADLLQSNANTTTFIYTRSWDPLYETDVLLDAFLRARSADPSIRLLLVGNGSQSESLRKFVESRGLNGAVSLIGSQPAEKLPMWFRAADAYISCAKSDGTSISLLEAMATGLPVVVTDIPSNREWVTEPENGWLATAGSADAVAEKMLRVAKLTSDERKAISERNQRVVAERADWDKNFPRLLEMYERLVSARNH